MRSKTTRKFWKEFDSLPRGIQKRAIQAYKLWLQNPNAQGLYFKLVSQKGPIYSVRIGLEHRALGVLRGDTITWYWIGHHSDYEKLV